MADLNRAIGEVDALIAPIEGTFVAIGDELGRALRVLGTLQGDFGQLSSGLDSDAARQAERGFGDALGRCGRLSGVTAQTARHLAAVGQAVAGSDAPLSSLRKILGEVGALAMNAKIQAAQVSAASVDFSVFTTEMARLHRLADGAVAQAGARLAELRLSIAAARKAEDDFRQSDAAELDKIRARMERGLAAFAERRQRSQQAMGSIAARSARIGDRVSECITQMQINDLIRQRLEHVREALELVRAMETGTAAEWTSALPAPRRQALMAAVCQLQVDQLRRAAEDFGAEVGRMKANIHGLAEDASHARSEAAALFGGGGGESFLAELRGDVDGASAILDAYAAANVQVRDAILGVMADFDAVAADIDTIHSIDADMRVMGLNASLKCGRLGGKGRALGVVAQELRACSRRTQEGSEGLSAAVAAARDQARALAEWVEEGHAEAATLRSALADSLQSLNHLGDTVHHSLDRLEADCVTLAESLAGTAAGIVIHDHMNGESARIAADVGAIAAALSVGSAPYDELDDDVRRLLAKHYTMASERVVHGMAADAPAAAADDDCDAFFL